MYRALGLPFDGLARMIYHELWPPLQMIKLCKHPYQVLAQG
jgi:hypothetical protein